MVAVALPVVHGSRQPPRPVSAAVRRRRRQVGTALAVLVALSVVWTLVGTVGWFGGGPLAVPEPVPANAVPAAVTARLVEPGDTLWSIAREFQPSGEIRPLVDRLMRERHGRPLQVGDRVTLP